MFNPNSQYCYSSIEFPLLSVFYLKTLAHIIVLYTYCGHFFPLWHKLVHLASNMLLRKREIYWLNVLNKIFSFAQCSYIHHLVPDRVTAIGMLIRNIGWLYFTQFRFFADKFVVIILFVSMFYVITVANMLIHLFL